MTPDKLKALQSVRDGGKVTRAQMKWLEHWGLIYSMTSLTVKGTEALADAECDEENTGD